MTTAAAGAGALVLGLTACATALIPAIGADLNASQSQLQWVADAFPLVLAMLLLPAGSMLDRFGRRRGMVAGLVLLALSLTWTGVAGTVEEVLVSRVLAGVGAALVLPATLATIRTALPADQQTRAIVIWALGLILGSFAGLVIGAASTEIATWQLAFLTFAAIALALAALAALALPADVRTAVSPFDWTGALLSTAGLGGIVFALTEGPVRGWTDAAVLGTAAVGLAALAAFVAVEARAAHPMLDVRLLRDPLFGTATATLLLLFLTDYGMFFVVFQYEAYVLGYSTLGSTLGLIPPALGMAISAPLSPLLDRRFGLRRTSAAALGLCAIGAVAAALSAGSASYWAMTPGLFVLWFGIGLGMLGPTEAILNALPEARQGVASAVNDLTRELGAAVGIAVAGTAFTAAYRGEIQSSLDDSGLSPDELLRSPASALDQGGGAAVHAAVSDGVLAGWRLALLVLGALLLAGCVLVARRGGDQAGVSIAASSTTSSAPQFSRPSRSSRS